MTIPPVDTNNDTLLSLLLSLSLFLITSIWKGWVFIHSPNSPSDSDPVATITATSRPDEQHENPSYSFLVAIHGQLGPRQGWILVGRLLRNVRRTSDRFHRKIHRSSRVGIDRKRWMEKFPRWKLFERSTSGQRMHGTFNTCAQKSVLRCTGLHVAIRVGVDDGAPTHPTMRVNVSSGNRSELKFRFVLLSLKI